MTDMLMEPLTTIGSLVVHTVDKAEASSCIEKWHYSKKLPVTSIYQIGAKLPGGLFGIDGEPVAVVCFGHPVNRHMNAETCIELIRMARRPEGHPDLKLSALVGFSLRWLRLNTKYKLVLSYADTTHNHHGGIYQATNFSFVGVSEAGIVAFKAPGGKPIHKRTCNARYGTSSVEAMAEIGLFPVYGKDKYLYVYPLAKKASHKKAILDHYEYESLPYPKPDIEASK